MDSLYIALLSSKRLINYLKEITQINPGYAGQKFNRLIIEGLKKNNINCRAFSSVPVNRMMSKKIFWNIKSEIEDSISYTYIPFVNLPYIHNICLLIYSFLYVLFWGIKNRKDKFVLMDVLNVSICLGSLFACKLLKLHCVGIVTDMPGLMIDASLTHGRRNIISAAKICQLYISTFDSYVFLTEQMNEVINKKHRPYIIMEGVADCKINPIENLECDKEDVVRTMLYAGGLHERYGLKLLVQAFTETNNINYRLIIYGSGPFVEELKQYVKKDPRIEYRGVASNDEVIDAELKATVLVNPRPTIEEFTKYSFPSKNMEYMSTGRPLLTTKLPGMPKEYNKYVYLFEEETIKGYKQAIETIFSKPMYELNQKGLNAQKWILENKNNIIQTKRILDLINYSK